MENCCKCITIDGRLDEQVWETAREFSGFKKIGLAGIPMEENQTFFKILTYPDRIVVGVKCMETDMNILMNAEAGSWGSPAVELFLSPSGNAYDYYHFFVAHKGAMLALYYEEGGNIKPDPYAPSWNAAVAYGDDFWSAEIEIPLTAFYMTSQDRWSDTWLVNLARTHAGPYGARYYSTWSTLKGKFNDPERFQKVDGFPIRDPKNELRIHSVQADIADETPNGFKGTLKVLVQSAAGGTFTYTTDYSEPVTVTLQPGFQEFTAPCCFPELTRFKVWMDLQRLDDGVTFSRRYPVMVTYEPIAIRFTKPEFRTNFYPSQDHSQIIGKATSAKQVTLKLEGPGIETQVITPDADGSFVFDTANFAYGDAILTATIDGYETVRKIRNLAPTGKMMSWISGGNLIVNGEPILRRNMYAEYYHGGVAFKRKYDADDLHQTLQIRGQLGYLEPGRLIKGVEAPGGEATLDARPTPAMLEKVDAVMDANKDRDFTFYYISDEPECRGLSRIYLKHLYDYITEKDPYHVVLTASRNAAELVDIADWFETHPYINPQTTEDGTRVYGRAISSMGKFVDDIINLNRTDKCIGFLPTCFAGMGGKREPYPTFDEYICHTWAAMIRGGKTLYPYAYHDLNDRACMYEGTRYIFSSFEALDKLVLLANRTVLLKNDEVEGVLYELDGEKMFVLVNKTNAPQQVVLEGISGQWHEFRHNRVITGNAFALKPLEVVIGTTEVKDAGLPTYAETCALIEKLEYERTHGGSLLFERRKDLTLTSSGSLGSAGKLFDGVRDNYAWEQVGDQEKFYEVGFTGFKPSFDKVVVCGNCVDNMELKVRNGGELTVPEIAEVQTEEFATTFILKEKIAPEALRLEFKNRRVELYEIEVF